MLEFRLKSGCRLRLSMGDITTFKVWLRVTHVLQS